MVPLSELPGRSGEPFFRQPSTVVQIKEIASTRDLVIYVGAGATMTESGHSWRSMVELLFGRLAEQHQTQVAAAISESFDLPKRASIVKEYFERTEPEAATETIANILRKALYQDAQWKRGDYATAIALLCQAKLALGHRIIVVTTNYDQYLEHALRKVGNRPDKPLAVRSVTFPLTGDLDVATTMAEDLSQADNEVLVVHFHGVVLEKADPRQSEDIVLDEVDYLRTEAQSSALLAKLFETNDLLILGSSLEDDPLLRALWLTRSKRRRWAVFPRQNYEGRPGAYGGHPNSYQDLIFALRCRSRLFDLNIIAPDFYYHASQFVREIGVATECVGNGTGYADYANRSHSKRLDTWWESWFTSRNSATPTAQGKDHRALMQATRAIKKQLGTGNGDEKLKLELWVRWKPGSDCRELQLWASSTGTWIDHTTMRNAEITVHSEYLAVHAFCTGVARMRDRNGKQHERWKRYLAVPIRVGPESLKIQTGVIILATTAADAHSTIDETNHGRMNVLSNLLTDIGTALLTPRS